jgi:uncharacterized membrane protein
MSESMRLIICTFDATDKADAVKDTLHAWERRLHTVKLGNIAIVHKTTEGQVSFRETHDIRYELGAMTGALAGGVAWFLYAFAGSFGPIAGKWAGYQVENAVERAVTDMGFPDHTLQQIGESLDAGSSALITLVRPDEEPIVVEELQRLGGTIVQHTIDAELAAELQATPGVRDSSRS